MFLMKMQMFYFRLRFEVVLRKLCPKLPLHELLALFPLQDSTFLMFFKFKNVNRAASDLTNWMKFFRLCSPLSLHVTPSSGQSVSTLFRDQS